jgi:prepilin-type N-terminal cleavage/methylation domain-containing protein
VQIKRVQIKRQLRQQSGFTLLELFAVVVIVAILALIALPSFLNVQDKVQTSAVKINMRTLQIAAETYASDHGGVYPTHPPTGEANDEFSSYFAGGSSGDKPLKPGHPPTNPYTDRAEWSDFKSFAINSVPAERKQVLGTFSPGHNYAGLIGYANPKDLGSAAYAIEGTDKHGIAVNDPPTNKTLVLSNQ